MVRSICKADSRVNYVKVTSKGKTILNQTKPIVKELFSRLESGIDKDEIKIAQKVIEQIQKNAIHELDALELKKNKP